MNFNNLMDLALNLANKILYNSIKSSTRIATVGPPSLKIA